MKYNSIIYEKVNRIAHITLNRPDRLNALSLELREELADAITMSGIDNEVNAIILKGAGRAFSSGYDLSYTKIEKGYGKSAETTRQDIDAMMSEIVDKWTIVWNSRKPIICQVHGYCLAGGTDLALNTDIIICTDDAQFGYPAVRAQGSPPSHMWTYLVGPQWAKYMLLTGNSIDGKMAERIGLVLKAVPADRLEEEVNMVAETMAKIPYGLLAATIVTLLVVPCYYRIYLDIKIKIFKKDVCDM